MVRERQIVVSTETAQRLKIYAVARDTTLEKLATEVLDLWLDEQPLVGGPKVTTIAAARQKLGSAT